jgi:GNAT superfamily N-acetyltransferase
MQMKKNIDKPAYKIVDVNETNIDEHGAFCLKSKKNTEGYKKQVEWIKERFKEGLHLKLLFINEGPKRGFRSRGFIEYIPGEYTWRGIDAKGYMVIHCIWVVGKNKNQGYGSQLLEQCLNDAKGMNGVAVVTSESTWLPKKKIFIKHGFERVDASPPDFELYVKRFSKSAPPPRFNPIPKERLEKYKSGVTVFKSDQCPYTSASVKALTEAAEQANLPLRIEQIKSCKEAQHGVHPYGTFCVLLNGKLLSYRPIGKKTLLDCLSKSK